MTPNARVAAAIEILDGILAGAPAEQHLTRWARGHRFAGSGDRAAIRDHVFDALRRRRSAAALGGGAGGGQSGEGWRGLCRLFREYLHYHEEEEDDFVKNLTRARRD